MNVHIASCSFLWLCICLYELFIVFLFQEVPDKKSYKAQEEVSKLKEFQRLLPLQHRQWAMLASDNYKRYKLEIKYSMLELFQAVEAKPPLKRLLFGRHSQYCPQLQKEGAQLQAKSH